MEGIQVVRGNCDCYVDYQCITAVLVAFLWIVTHDVHVQKQIQILQFMDKLTAFS